MIVRLEKHSYDWKVASVNPLKPHTSSFYTIFVCVLLSSSQKLHLQNQWSLSRSPPSWKMQRKTPTKSSALFSKTTPCSRYLPRDPCAHMHVHAPRLRARTTTAAEFLQERLLLFVFQESGQNFRILDDVVEITVENEVISNLSEPIKIAFRHDVIPVGLHAHNVAVLTINSSTIQFFYNVT